MSRIFTAAAAEKERERPHAGLQANGTRSPSQSQPNPKAGRAGGLAELPGEDTEARGGGEG